MDRNEFLKMAQQASVCYGLPPNELLVVYRGVKYIPVGYEMTFCKGQPVRKGILKSLSANAYIWAKLENLTKQKDCVTIF